MKHFADVTTERFWENKFYQLESQVFDFSAPSNLPKHIHLHITLFIIRFFHFFGLVSEQENWGWWAAFMRLLNMSVRNSDGLVSILQLLHQCRFNLIFTSNTLLSPSNSIVMNQISLLFRLILRLKKKSVCIWIIFLFCFF